MMRSDLASISLWVFSSPAGSPASLALARRQDRSAAPKPPRPKREPKPFAG